MRNNLWKAEGVKPKFGIRLHKFKKDDVVCPECINNKICKGYCPLVKGINGRSDTKEILPDRPVIQNGIEQMDYNAAIYELIADQQARDVDRLDTIRAISNHRTRAIAACILAYIPQDKIARYLHMSQGYLSKLYRGMQK
jgi:hypothetical protein